MANAQAVGALDTFRRQAPSGEVLDLGRVYRGRLSQSKLHTTPKRVLSRREAALLGIFALALHGAVIYWINSTPTPALPVVPPEIPPMTIEFSQPAPPVVETPPPAPEPVVQPEEPPPPVVDELASKPAPPKPVPKPKSKPVVKKTPPKPVPKPAVQPAPPPQPVAAPAPPAPPKPAPAPEPVTPASANAGYLKNPAPQYPALAMRRNWEGTVLLRVHVLANGKPGDVQIQKSSGRSQLDDAALAAVKRWSFAPAKQGNQPVDGYVSVPIDFKLN